MSSTQMTSDLIVYKIDASRCDIKIGDIVTPGQVIGEDFDSEDKVQVHCNGRVEGLHFSGADHAFVVLIRCDETRKSDDEIVS